MKSLGFSFNFRFQVRNRLPLSPFSPGLADRPADNFSLAISPLKPGGPWEANRCNMRKTGLSLEKTPGHTLGPVSPRSPLSPLMPLPLRPGRPGSPMGSRIRAKLITPSQTTRFHGLGDSYFFSQNLPGGPSAPLLPCTEKNDFGDSEYRKSATLTYLIAFVAFPGYDHSELILERSPFGDVRNRSRVAWRS